MERVLQTLVHLNSPPDSQSMLCWVSAAVHWLLVWICDLLPCAWIKQGLEEAHGAGGGAAFVKTILAPFLRAALKAAPWGSRGMGAEGG